MLDCHKSQLWDNATVWVLSEVSSDDSVNVSYTGLSMCLKLALATISHQTKTGLITKFLGVLSNGASYESTFICRKEVPLLQNYQSCFKAEKICCFLIGQKNVFSSGHLTYVLTLFNLRLQPQLYCKIKFIQTKKDERILGEKCCPHVFNLNYPVNWWQFGLRDIFYTFFMHNGAVVSQ